QLLIDLDDEAKGEIARRARRTPRIANRLLRRVRDFAEVKADGNLTLPVTRQALSMMHIDEAGLDAADRSVLAVIIEKFQGGPVGLNTISAATAQELETIEEVIEPFLLQLGFLQRTPRGRLATPKAYQHLGL
ncbi:MAG: Holliday junction DNA helicase RuvB C-terminal domain-containing protein, partial [Patescibacteria group bacterium]